MPDQRDFEHTTDEVDALRRRIAQLEAAQAERHRADAALRESQRRLATLLSNLPGMAYRCRNDADWTMEFVSEGCFALTGRSRSEIILNRAVSWNDVIHPDDRQAVREGVERAVAAKQKFQLTYRIRTASGRQKWVWEQGTGVFDAGGSLAAIEGFIADITETVHALEALRQAHSQLEQRVDQRTRELARANEQLQAIYDGAVDGLLVAEVATRRFVRTNQAMLRMTGYREEELLSLGVDALHPPEDLPYVFDAFQTLAEEGAFPVQEFRLVRKDGSVFHAEVGGRRIEYQGRPCLIGFFRDVTARKEAENAIRQSEEKYRRLVEACPDAVLVTDLDGGILFASQETWTLLKVPRDAELRGRTVLEYTIEADRERLAASLRQLIESGPRRGNEYTVVRRDGTTMPVEVSSAVIRDVDGRPRALVAVVRDVTERKKAQQALERERQTLWHMLRSSDHERQLIAYEIHDGLAQQLAAAIMQFQSCDYLDGARPEEAKTAFAAGIQMLRQAHAETRRLISGVRPPILDESGLTAAIAHLVHDQRRPNGPEIEFDSRVAFDRLAPVVENAVYRIAQEALANACKHSRAERIRVALFQDDDRLRLEVRDGGVGFDPEAVGPNRFGLEGIRERGRLLGGRVSIDSRPGKGTRVCIVLPLVGPELGASRL